MKKLLLSFKNDNSINNKLLSTLSVKFPGYYYLAQRQDNDKNTCIQYYPKSSNYLIKNSFIPVITVKIVPNSTELVLSITGKKTNTCRFVQYFFYVILALMECFLIINYFDGLLENQLVVFIPFAIFTFLIVLSTIAERLSVKSFVVEYRNQINQLICKSTNP